MADALGCSPGAVVGVESEGSEAAAAASARKGDVVDIERVTARSGSCREARMQRVQNILCGLDVGSGVWEQTRSWDFRCRNFG